MAPGLVFRRRVLAVERLFHRPDRPSIHLPRIPVASDCVSTWVSWLLVGWLVVGCTISFDEFDNEQEEWNGTERNGTYQPYLWIHMVILHLNLHRPSSIIVTH